MRTTNKYFFALSVILVANSTFANDFMQIKRHKDFGPPPPITPNIAQSYMIENQFDKTNRLDYYFVTKNIDNAQKNLFLTSGIYGSSTYNSALFRLRESSFYTILNLNHTNARSYKDGDGNKVDFGYKRFNQSAIIGFVPNELSEFRFTLIHDNIKDDKQPQHKMDAVNTDRLITKLNARFGLEDLSNTLNLEFTNKKIKRDANNFKLRKAGQQKVRLEVDRDIFSTNLKYDLDINPLFHNTLETGIEFDHHNAQRFAITPKKELHNGSRVPDVKNLNYFVQDSINFKPNEFNNLTFLLGYHHQKSKIGDLTTNFQIPGMAPAMAINPQKIYKTIYGVDVNSKLNKHYVDTIFAYELKPDKFTKYGLEVGRAGRFGDNTELFGAMSKALANNPLLKPEIHHYVKLDFNLKSEFYKGYLNSIIQNSFEFGGEFVADKVKDFIAIDKSQNNPNIIITKNIDATILSANLYANYNFAKNYAFKAKLFYNYGKNSSEQKPLYQVRPFEANLNFDYKDYASFGSYNLGLGVRHVAKQKRGDWSNAMDIKETAKSFTTADIYAGLNFKDRVGVRFGVNNIFNKKYAEFISGNHVEATTPKIVNAPGRTFYVSVNANF